MMRENNLVLNDFNPLVANNIENNNIYTLIEINSRMYAIDTRQVLEIVKLIELDYSHQMPSYILGIMEFDKEPVGVIDLREVFKKERIIYSISSKLIVIKAQGMTTSIICDRVCDIKKLNKKNIKEIPYQEDVNFFDGLYIDDEKDIYILNVDNILKYLQEHKEKYENNQNFIKYIAEDKESKEVLKTRKNFLSKITTEVQVPTPLYDRGVSFLINNVKYYINMASVKEFYKVNNSKFVRVPSTEDYIFGLVNIKGDFVTVLDLRRFFQNPKTELKEKSTIIILNSEEYKIGILADEICENINIDFDEIVQNRLQNQEENKLMQFVVDNEIYQVVDVEKLLQDERLTIVQ